VIGRWGYGMPDHDGRGSEEGINRRADHSKNFVLIMNDGVMDKSKLALESWFSILNIFP